MGNDALGTWRKPPLAYVVAELVISPYYQLAKYIGSIQQALRGQYPRTIEGTEISLLPDPQSRPEPHQVWRLIAEDQRRGVHIAPRAISLHTTRYVNSSEFLTAWDHVLGVIEESDLKPFVERIGLRYMDLIVPEGSDQPSDYVQAGARGVVLYENSMLQQNVWVASYLVEGFNVNARVGAPSPVGMSMPPNLEALPIHKPEVWLSAEKRVTEGKPVGFIDIDAMLSVAKVFVSTDLSVNFRKLREKVAQAFQRLISDKARKEWS